MRFNKLLKQNRSLPDKFGNLIQVQTTSKIQTRHHVQNNLNGIINTADDLVLALDLFIHITILLWKKSSSKAQSRSILPKQESKQTKTPLRHRQ